MRCKKIKKLIIKNQVDKLKQEEQQLLSEHVQNCLLCQQFQKETEDWQHLFEAMKNDPLPETLDQQTQAICLQALAETSSNGSTLKRLLGQERIPKFIWAAMAIILAFTFSLLISSFNEFFQDETLSAKAITSLLLIGQNALMLIISPLLIFRYGKKFSKRMVIKNGKTI